MWTQAFTAGSSDYGRSIAVERCGGQVIVAATFGSGDAWLGGMTSLGEPRWDRRVQALYEGRGAVVIDDGEGGWIVAGQRGVGTENDGPVDAGWLLRVESDGTEVWRAHMLEDAEERASFAFESVAQGDDGVILVAGHTRIAYQRTPLAAAYTAGGELLWAHVREPADGLGSLRAALPLPDSSDTLFVGSLERDEGRGLFLLRLSAEGEVLSERHRPDTQIGSARAVLMPEGESVLIAASGRILEIDLDGEVLQELALEEAEQPFALALDGSEGIYVAGRLKIEEWVYQPWILRLTRDFAREWQTTEPREGELSGVTVGPRGDAFVVGYVEAPPTGEMLDVGNADVWIARFAR